MNIYAQPILLLVIAVLGIPVKSAATMYENTRCSMGEERPSAVWNDRQSMRTNGGESYPGSAKKLLYVMNWYVSESSPISVCDGEVLLDPIADFFASMGLRSAIIDAFSIWPKNSPFEIALQRNDDVWGDIRDLQSSELYVDSKHGQLPAYAGIRRESAILFLVGSCLTGLFFLNRRRRNAFMRRH